MTGSLATLSHLADTAAGIANLHNIVLAGWHQRCERQAFAELGDIP
ncbi:hypothetical protein [Salinispora fenicalii]|nr:hypothetical protein [Salinispora fenicalii]